MDVGRVVNMLSIRVAECIVVRVGEDMVSSRLYEWRRSKKLVFVCEAWSRSMLKSPQMMSSA